MTAAIRTTDFRRLLRASALSNLGDGIRLVAFPLLAASLTSNKLTISLVAAAGMAPWLVFGLYAGSLADRVDRLLLLRSANGARAVLLFLLALTVATGWATVALVGAAAFVLGVAEVLTDSTVSVITPSLVAMDDLDRANSRLVAAEILGNELVGPALGAVLFGVGAAIPFLTNAGLLSTSFFLLAGIGLLAPTPVPAPTATPGPWGSLEFIRSNPGLRGITLASATLGAIDAAWFSLLVVLVGETLGLRAHYFGILLAVGSGGGLLGAGVGDRLKGPLRSIGVGVFTSMGASLGLVVLFPRVASVAIALIVTSAGFTVWNVRAVTARQRLTPDHLLGRVTATYRVIVFGSSIGGAILGGAFAQQFGLPPTLAGAGILAILATPFALRLSDPPKVR